MNKLFMTACVAAFTSVALTGCFPQTRSVGFSLMPTPLIPRANGDDEHAYLSLAGAGYYGHTGKPADNVNDVNIGGGNVSATFRFGNFFSPLFINTALGAFRGYSGFSCSTENCTEKDRDESEKYRAWLETPEGKDTYSTWASQERFMVGLDFNPGPYLILGLAYNWQWYQEGGKYYRMRRNLDDPNNRIANSDDRKSDASEGLSIWFGSHLGRQGQYGSFVVQIDVLYTGNDDECFSSATKYTYTHPSGFFVGYQYGSIVSHSFYFGKEFVF